MRTSSRITAISSCSSARSACSPDSRAHQPLAERLEHRLQRHQVLAVVVDQEDPDRFFDRSRLNQPGGTERETRLGGARGSRWGASAPVDSDSGPDRGASGLAGSGSGPDCTEGSDVMGR